MRLSAIVLFTGLIAVSAQAQSLTLNGPTLGFTADDAGTVIRPILGLPGASILGDRFQLETGIRGLVFSPKHDYAIAAKSDDGQLTFIDLRGDTPASRTLGGVANILAVSPRGSTVATYDSQARTVQIIAGLPDDPQLQYQADTSAISGNALDLAVNDDGSAALMRFAEGDQTTLWVLDASGNTWQAGADAPTAAAFLPNSSDAIVADDLSQSVFLLMDLHHAAARVPLISGEDGLITFAAVASSDDGRSVFVADAKSGNIGVVNRETGRPMLVSCGCLATGFYRLKGNSIFGLSQASTEAMMVLDASGAEPKILIIPPGAPAAAEAQ
jgi:hypothetical protein